MYSNWKWGKHTVAPLRVKCSLHFQCICTVYKINSIYSRSHVHRASSNVDTRIHIVCVRVCECVYVAVWLWIVYRILNGIRCKAIGMMKNVSLSLSFRSQFDRSVRSSPIATRLTERILYVRCTQGIESRTYVYMCE